jgi:endonuclease/exonuclease/phosphatase (EEP) superfamily protein YafD
MRVAFWLAAAGLLLPAVPLTLNRLVDAEAGPAVRMMAFTPYATPFYVLDVLLIGGALALGWAGPRQVLAGLLVLPVLLLALHLWWLAPHYVGDNPAPAEGATPVVVMTFNLYEGNADAEQVYEVMRDRDVDVAVLPEITFGVLRDLQALGLDEDYPFQVGEPNGAVDGTMVLSRLPLGTPERLPVTFQSWQVEVGEGAEAFTMLAVHPLAPVPPAGVRPWFTENATLLAAAEAADADVVLGDFNATSDHAPMRSWRDAGWRDSLELVNAGWTSTWPANGITPYPGVSVPPVIQIDHVLVGPRFAVTASSVVDVDGSDHRAVLATVARR